MGEPILPTSPSGMVSEIPAKPAGRSSPISGVLGGSAGAGLRDELTSAIGSLPTGGVDNDRGESDWARLVGYPGVRSTDGADGELLTPAERPLGVAT
mmetsp:Transcript_81978/g.150245  ORF Transcript_81978/g.150245 Transcript_81978/m.150245 type:complete len:97 (-) Transcript_81978:608-898(-)